MATRLGQGPGPVAAHVYLSTAVCGRGALGDVRRSAASSTVRRRRWWRAPTCSLESPRHSGHASTPGAAAFDLPGELPAALPIGQHVRQQWPPSTALNGPRSASGRGLYTPAPGQTTRDSTTTQEVPGGGRPPRRPCPQGRRGRPRPGGARHPARLDGGARRTCRWKRRRGPNAGSLALRQSQQGPAPHLPRVWMPPRRRRPVGVSISSPARQAPTRSIGTSRRSSTRPRR